MTEQEIRNEKTQKLLKVMRTAYIKTFESAAGKIVLADLRKCLPEVMAECGTTDPCKTYYGMGRRSVMLMIEEKLKERKDG